MAEDIENPEQKEWVPQGYYLFDTITKRILVDIPDGRPIGCWEIGPGLCIICEPISLPTLRRLSGIVKVKVPPPSLYAPNGITLKELRDAGRILPENEEERAKREKIQRMGDEIMDKVFPNRKKNLRPKLPDENPKSLPGPKPLKW